MICRIEKNQWLQLPQLRHCNSGQEQSFAAVALTSEEKCEACRPCEHKMTRRTLLRSMQTRCLRQAMYEPMLVHMLLTIIALSGKGRHVVSQGVAHPVQLAANNFLPGLAAARCRRCFAITSDEVYAVLGQAHEEVVAVQLCPCLAARQGNMGDQFQPGYLLVCMLFQGI